jgi:hypothetical protein
MTDGELYNENDREELRKKIGTKKLAKLESKAAKREANEVQILKTNIKNAPFFISNLAKITVSFVTLLL